MRYINAIQGSLIALAIFIMLAIFIPVGKPIKDIEIILTVSTFLFAILAGFFIARSNSRYDTMRDLVADEDAYWLSFYYSAKFFGKKFLNRVRNLMDQYYIIAFDFELGEYYKHNAKHIAKLYDELKNYKKTRDASVFFKEVYDEMINKLGNIELARNKSSVIAIIKMTKGQWAILITLAAIVAVTVYYLRNDNLFFKTAAALLSTTLVLVLLTLRDLEKMRLTGKDFLMESGEEVLETIGKKRYYNRRYLIEGTTKVPENIKQYRLGLHAPGEKIRIKTINVKNPKIP